MSLSTTSQSATSSNQLQSKPRSDAGGNEIETLIRDVFRRQQANRWNVAATTAEQRIEKLKRFKAAILRRAEELRAALAQDFRKPAAEVDITELQPVIMEINHTIGHLKKWMKPKKVSTPFTLWGTRSVVRHEPKGVVLILSPWNYPFNLMMSPFVAAIAAGNCVMMRPSDKVQRTSGFMKSLIEEVFPMDEAAIFTGPSSIANILLELPFDHVLFTGSTRIGKQVMAAASKHLAPVTLELGGQSPVIVDQSSDAKIAAERIVWGKFLNAGQTCVAPNHVFVHESKIEEFLNTAKKTIERNYGSSEDVRKQSPDFARIVDDSSFKRLKQMIEDAVSNGAKTVIGGTGDATERYIAPTVLSNVTPDSPAMGEEIFGPVLPVLSYRSLDDVIKDIQSRGKPLAMYIFSRDENNLNQLLTRTTAGGTVINHVVIHLGNPDLPFGGVGESGMGNYHGWHGFLTFSHERSVLCQGSFSAVKWFYPPYTATVKKLIGWLTRFIS